MNTTRGFWLLLALICGLAMPRWAAAISYVMMEDADLFDQSQGVVVANVIRALPVRDGDLETRYLLEIRERVAGSVIKPRQILALPGTFNAPSINAIVPGVPQLVEGRNILLFYSRGKDGGLRPQQLLLGLFGELRTASGSVWVRALDYGREHRGGERSLLLRAPRDGAGFVQWLRDRAHGIKREPDYLLPSAEQGVQPKYALSSFTLGATTAPGRFFVFDQNKTMQWTAQPGGQAGATHDISSLQAAIAAWTDDPGSKILLDYDGTVDYPPNGSQYRMAPCDRQGGIDTDQGCYHGHVTWNDTESLIGGSFSCSGGGTLAFGGSYVVSPARSFSGQSWFPRFSAFVVVQDGAACAIDGHGGDDGAELLAHETGHSLALGHSCDESGVPACNGNSILNEAIMRPYMHADGRGAQLGVDDQAGMAIAYPETAVSVGPNINPLSPANNSTTALGGGAPGASVNGQISFQVSGGSGSGTTQLSCSVNGGSVSITGNASQTIAVGGSVQPVGVKFTLSGASQSGQIKCTATPQGAAASTYTYHFTANAATQGPTITPQSPANNSTTSLGGGVPGASVSGQISFQVNGGSGSGTTQLNCNVNSGSVSITGNASQTIAVGGSVQPVGVTFTLSGASQSGQIKCTATPQNAAATTYTYNFTANAATQGPTITPQSPINNSTTHLGGGTEGDHVQGLITFLLSSGSGGGTTQLNCSVSSGTVVIVNNASQTIATNGPVQPVKVEFTLTLAAQAGQVQCTATPQNASAATYTYTFTAAAGVPDPNQIFKDGFEG
ncbi:MAG TPA: hypothetical protein VFN29_10425 [Chiayiivirga sp.]|nr:hypothetical protein [Chiayiivirga sp.]